MIETVTLNRAKQAYLEMLIAEKEELEESFERLKDQLGVRADSFFKRGSYTDICKSGKCGKA